LQEQVEQMRQSLKAAEMRLANLTQPPAMPPAEPTEPVAPPRQFVGPEGRMPSPVRHTRSRADQRP
jgi:hypothetical protein